MKKLSLLIFGLMVGSHPCFGANALVPISFSLPGTGSLQFGVFCFVYGDLETKTTLASTVLVVSDHDDKSLKITFSDETSLKAPIKLVGKVITEKRSWVFHQPLVLFYDRLADRFIVLGDEWIVPKNMDSLPEAFRMQWSTQWRHQVEEYLGSQRELKHNHREDGK